MPAPVPIQIRYGPSGLLMQAAAAAGSNQGYSQQRALDMDFLNREMDRRQRTKEMLAQQEMEDQRLQLESHRLQQAHEQSLQAQPLSFGGTGDSTRRIKDLYLQNAVASGVSEPIAAILKTAVNDANVNPAMMKQIADDSEQQSAIERKQQQETTKRQTDRTAKGELLKQVAGKLPDWQTAGLKPLAEDDNLDVGQFRTAVDSAINRVNVATRTRLNKTVQNFDDQIDQVQQQLSHLDKQMVDAGVRPEASPSEMNPAFREPPPSQGGVTGDDLPITTAWANIKGAFGGDISLASGGNPQGMQMLIDRAKLRNSLNALTKQRDAAVASATSMDMPGTPAAVTAAAPAASGKPITPQIVAQLLAEAKGDKNAARQLARSRGYTF